MNITSATGSTLAQVAMRKALGRWRKLDWWPPPLEREHFICDIMG